MIQCNQSVNTQSFLGYLLPWVLWQCLNLCSTRLLIDQLLLFLPCSRCERSFLFAHFCQLSRSCFRRMHIAPLKWAVSLYMCMYNKIDDNMMNRLLPYQRVLSNPKRYETVIITSFIKCVWVCSHQVRVFNSDSGEQSLTRPYYWSNYGCLCQAASLSY